MNTKTQPQYEDLTTQHGRCHRCLHVSHLYQTEHYGDKICATCIDELIDAKKRSQLAVDEIRFEAEKRAREFFAAACIEDMRDLRAAIAKAESFPNK